MPEHSVIIFPTDFSGTSLAALPWARKMASVLDGEIHCLYVVEEPQIYATLDMGPVPIPTTGELTTTARTRLDAFVRENLRDMDRKVVTEVLVGRPADQIVSYAKGHGARMIVMTTHGYGGVKHVLLGSTTESVLRHADCPVLSIRNT